MGKYHDNIKGASRNEGGASSIGAVRRPRTAAKCPLLGEALEFERHINPSALIFEKTAKLHSQRGMTDARKYPTMAL